MNMRRGSRQWSGCDQRRTCVQNARSDYHGNRVTPKPLCSDACFVGQETERKGGGSLESLSRHDRADRDTALWTKKQWLRMVRHDAQPVHYFPFSAQAPLFWHAVIMLYLSLA